MRIWQIKFEVHKAIASFPVPGELVEEIQEKPSYRLDGSKRQTTTGCQLSYTLSGRGIFKWKNIEYQLLPGKAFLHKHNDADTAYYYPVDGKEPWIFLWISFYGEVAEAMVTDLVERYGYIYRLPENSGLIKRLRAYKNYKGMVQGMTPLSGAKLVMDVLTGLGDEFEKELSNSPQSNVVRRAQELIHENIDKNIKVEEIAEKLSVSREHLSRSFKEQSGVSPQDYILSKKMKYACYLLRDTGFSCKEIGMKIGYDNPASFSRAFKNIYNISPADIRTTGYFPD